MRVLMPLAIDWHHQPYTVTSKQRAICPVGFSRLALNVRLFAKVVRLFDVRPGSFIPSPDWDDTKTACLQD